MKEFSPFSVGRVHQLKNEWAARDDSGSARQKVASDKVFEHRRFARALSAYDGDLREVDLHAHARGGARVLQPVDERDESLHS